MLTSIPLNIALFVPNPTLTSVTPHGATSTKTWGYKIVGVAADGTETAVSAEVTTTTGVAALDGTNYNVLVWTDPLNAVSVKIYRTTCGAASTPATTGLIGTVAAGVQTFNDTGIAGDSATPSATNGTGNGTEQRIAQLTGSLVWQLDGTFVGTVKLQGRINPSGTWFDIGAGLTSPAITQITGLYFQVRAKVTAYTSGAPTVTVAGNLT